VYLPAVQLRIIEADLFATTADAILLPIDGRLPAHASSDQIARLLGRAARELHMRHPEAEVLDEIESQVDFPLAFGAAAQVELGHGTSFRHAILLSMLPHQADDLTAEVVRTAVTNSLTAALERCHQQGFRSVVTPVLVGGSRLPAAEAEGHMLRVLAEPSLARLDVVVNVCLSGKTAAADAARMRELARSLGFET
jgi:hypothetical protein